MKILVINSGSSSIKYRLVESATGEALAGGLIERIGLPDGRMSHQRGAAEKVRYPDRPIPDHEVGLTLLLEALVDPAQGALASLAEIGAVGHRVVHGGERFSDPVLITPEIVAEVEECSAMAPLHNPANLLGIGAASRRLPGVPNVAVFDTAFHQTMPPVAYVTGLPYEFYERSRIRRYGFHGTSHQYVAGRVAKLLGRPIEDLSMIVCHLGNGSSVTAVQGGRSVDTSLGLGTVCGVMMGTRTGDLDPAIVLELIEAQGLTAAQVKDLVYKKSGLLGVSGVSSDMRDVEAAAASGNERARLALEMFADRVRKYVGAYAVTLGALHAIAFTAGIGENDPETRERICRGLDVIGARLDPDANARVRGREADVTAFGSPVKILVVPTNEELMIARETERVLGAA